MIDINSVMTQFLSQNTPINDYFFQVSVTYRKWAAYNGTDPYLWISWAQWEIEGRNNFDKAREILLVLAPKYIIDSPLILREVSLIYS